MYVNYNSAAGENERDYQPTSFAESGADKKNSAPNHTYYLYAQAEEGSFFVGWFDNEACTESALYTTTTDCQVTIKATSKDEDNPTTQTYYAKFYSRQPLYDVISEAEAFDGRTINTLATNLTNALTTAKNLTGSTNITDIDNAVTSLTNALTAAKAVDVTILENTIEIAQAKGLNVTEANTFLTSGTTKEQYEEVLYNLRTEIRMSVLDKHADVFSGNAPAANGDFYLYNVGTGAFFCGGSDWGAHAAIGFPGIKVTLVAGNEGYVIDTHLNNGGTREYLNYTGYCDTDAQDTWTFVSTGDGKSYLIKRANDPSKMLDWNPTTLNGYTDGHSGPYYNNVSTFEEDASSENNKWVLVTEAERNALMEDASADNPVDVSYLIQSPNLNQREVISAWQMAQTEGSTMGAQTHRGDQRLPYYIYDAYNSEYTDIHQTVTGLRPGVYKVAVTAAYKKPGFAEGDVTNARLYAYKGAAKDGYVASEELNTVLLPNIISGLGKAPGFDTTEKFGSHLNVNKALELGAFEQTEILVTVGSAGTLTFGIMKEDGGNSDCTYADDWRLSYLGLPEITIGSANYTTFVAPYNISELPEGVEAYACQVTTGSDYVHLEPVDAIPEDEAVVLKQTGTYTFQPATGDVELGAENDLLPSDGKVVGGETIYALAKKNNVVGCYPVAATVTIPAGKAYLVISGTNAKPFYGFEEDDATGIEEIENAVEDGAIYNMAGQRLNKMQKGINIVNGRKVLY